MPNLFPILSISYLFFFKQQQQVKLESQSNDNEITVAEVTDDVVCQTNHNEAEIPNNSMEPAEIIR